MLLLLTAPCTSSDTFEKMISPGGTTTVSPGRAASSCACSRTAAAEGPDGTEGTADTRKAAGAEIS